MVLIYCGLNSDSYNSKFLSDSPIINGLLVIKEPDSISFYYFEKFYDLFLS